MIIILNKTDLNISSGIKRPSNLNEKDFNIPLKIWETAEVVLFQENYGDVHVLKAKQGVSHG